MHINNSSDVLNDYQWDISKENQTLKNAIWIYFFLLVFEGALRKWVLPSLAGPLIIVRDPFAIFIIFKAFYDRVLRVNLYIGIAWFISFISFYATLLWGHGNVYTALYGLRILVLHFPLIFIIGRVFDRGDVLALGKVLLWINIGMTILVALQFFSPQTAWVNRGIGGDMEGSGFSGTSNFYRVPGTFSFTNGIALFYGLVVTFIFNFWLDKKRDISNWHLILATLSLLLAVPLTLSRTLFFQVILSGLFTIISSARSPKSLFNILSALIIGILLFWGMSNFSFFQTASLAFQERYESASNAEGGLEGTLIDRFLGGVIGGIINDQNTGFWGKGLGLGTNAGSMFVVGRSAFLAGEGEWGRLVGEMGIVLGYVAILIRLILTINLGRWAWSATYKDNYLPWLLLSFAAIQVQQGQWGQPTSLGFGVFAGGLILAGLNDSKGE